MEAVIDQALSAYELERSKPMPNLTHGSIQANLVFELKTAYRNQFRIASEVTLATQPDGSTPDVVAYPLIPLGFGDEPARRTDAPLLCIEIQSPSQSLEQMVEKTTIYFSFGVRSCWIVVPAVKGVFVYDQPGHYQFFHEPGMLHDAILDIKLDLPAVFA
ncbi:hypothetical protein GCM10023187_35270 [Nibrella viscosa]|uniref:Putative restriction endonuclease domain-containing protein n=1 Tax=Nibrella viscosa TaxID=1084524 RepID=A0ABP8KLZ7_9BACT